jgi:hypothetical protein
MKDSAPFFFRTYQCTFHCAAMHGQAQFALYAFDQRWAI